MVSLEETLHLEPGEEIIALFRRHGATALKHLFPVALFLVLLFLFIFPLFSLGSRGVILFFALCVVACLIAVRKICAWLGTITILTSNRLLVIRRFGFFKKTVSEIKLDQISELSYEVKGMMQAMGRYGTISLLVTFTSVQITIPDIPDPQSALNEISQAIQRIKKYEQESQSKKASAHTPIDVSKDEKQQRPVFHHIEKSDPANWR